MFSNTKVHLCPSWRHRTFSYQEPSSSHQALQYRQLFSLEKPSPSSWEELLGGAPYANVIALSGSPCSSKSFLYHWGWGCNMRNDKAMINWNALKKKQENTGKFPQLQPQGQLLRQPRCVWDAWELRMMTCANLLLYMVWALYLLFTTKPPINILSCFKHFQNALYIISFQLSLFCFMKTQVNLYTLQKFPHKYIWIPNTYTPSVSDIVGKTLCKLMTKHEDGQGITLNPGTHI